MLDRVAPRVDGVHLRSDMQFYFRGDIGVSAWLYDLRQVSPEALAGSTFCDQK
jgi:hypothetical protein